MEGLQEEVHPFLLHQEYPFLLHRDIVEEIRLRNIQHLRGEKRKHDAVEEPPLPLQGGYNTEPHQVAAPQQQDEQPPNNNNTQQQQTKPSKKRRSRRKKAVEVDPEAERQEAELRAKIKASLHSQRVSRKDVEEEEAKKTRVYCQVH